MPTSTAKNLGGDAELEVFPNPASGPFQVNVGTSGTARLFDLQGRQVHESSLQSGTNRLNPNVPAGTYLLQVTQTDGSFNTQKLLIR